MPIANCYLDPLVLSSINSNKGALIDTWAVESGIKADQMTINIIAYSEQAGRQYQAIANLYLPSLWSEENVSSIQVGLARSIAAVGGVTPDKIMVMTQIIASGHVVENGGVVTW